MCLWLCLSFILFTDRKFQSVVLIKCCILWIWLYKNEHFKVVTHFLNVFLWTLFKKILLSSFRTQYYSQYRRFLRHCYSVRPFHLDRLFHFIYVLFNLWEEIYELETRNKTMLEWRCDPSLQYVSIILVFDLLDLIPVAPRREHTAPRWALHSSWSLDPSLSAVHRSSQLPLPLFKRFFSECSRVWLSSIPPEGSTQEPLPQWQCPTF